MQTAKMEYLGVMEDRITSMANRFWEQHPTMRVPLTSLAEATRLADEVKSGTVVLMDAADALALALALALARAMASLMYGIV